MSLRFQSRRLVAAASSRPSAERPSFLIPNLQRRTIFGFRNKDNHINNRNATKLSNPLTDEYLTRKPTTPSGGLVRGTLAKSSVFEDEEIAGPKPAIVKADDKGDNVARNPNYMAAALDPRPDQRIRWERKMTAREVRKRGRLSRTQLIKRQEREVQSKSHNFKTSVKKLMPLARQISGKTVEQAILQMRFSKKKVASEVRKHLEHARNEAIVRRGMGLGAIDGKKLAQPLFIKTNDGKRVKVEDPTTIYVDQAWVGKGDYGQTPDYRARGQIHLMKNPTTHLAVILKEEATRIRQHQEREDKFNNRKVRVQLPNRPITGQRQYYSW